MRLYLFIIKVNYGSFLDGRIVIKIKDMPNNSLAWIYIQKKLQHFVKYLWINFKVQGWAPQHLANKNIIPYMNQQIKKLETDKITE